MGSSEIIQSWWIGGRVCRRMEQFRRVVPHLPQTKRFHATVLEIAICDVRRIVRQKEHSTNQVTITLLPAIPERSITIHDVFH